MIELRATHEEPLTAAEMAVLADAFRVLAAWRDEMRGVKNSHPLEGTVSNPNLDSTPDDVRSTEGVWRSE